MTQPLSSQAVDTLLAHLDREETYFARLTETVRHLRVQPLTTAAETWPVAFEQLQTEATGLGRHRDAVRRLLKVSTGSEFTSLATVPLCDSDRVRMDRRRREVRTAAATAAGLLRGWMMTLSVWNDATSAALDTLFGVSPQESMYSATGARVPPSGRVLLESRS